MKYQNLTIIGTSHIAKQSSDEVKQTIEREKPAIVALELDQRRLAGLLQGVKSQLRLRDIRRLGFKGFLFALLGNWAERKLGNIVGVSPGAEMVTAYHEAKKCGAKVAVIDQEIEITLKRFSQRLSWKEKFRFVIDVIKAVIFRKKIVSFDLNKVPSEELIEKLIGQLQVRYPNVYDVLVRQRNYFMAKKLAKLMQQEQKPIIAIVGAGHGKEIIRIVKNIMTNKAEMV